MQNPEIFAGLYKVPRRRFNMGNKTVGVLALQGDFLEHERILSTLHANSVQVRNKEDLVQCSALIIPGGESTTISHLLSTTGLDSEIKKRVSVGMPLYGTCAGAILIAKKVVGEKRFRPLGLIDIEVERNAYGRQVDSFEAELDTKFGKKIHGIFIRSPVIKKIASRVEVLAALGKRPVLVKQGKIIAGTFHPELAGETAVHKMFLGLV